MNDPRILSQTDGRADRAGGRLVLVTGAGGYIGPVVTEYLLGRGYRVRALDLFLYGTRDVLGRFEENENFELVTGDHCDPASMRRALENVSDIIVLSGLVGDPITKRYPEAARLINEDGLRALIGVLRNEELDRVVFVSTCSNYGFVDDEQSADEAFELMPLSAYARAKVSIEKEILRLAGSVAFHPTILRFATAFGLAPRMRFDLTVNQFVRDLYLGRELLVYDAATWRPYCHVRDFGEVIAHVLEAPSEAVSFEVFNAGGNVNNFTKQMIVDAIVEFLPQADVGYQKKGPDPRNYRVDFSKIRDHLGFEPKHAINDGIAELIEALDRGQFADVDDRPNFYGNYEIQYPLGGETRKGGGKSA